MKSSLNRLYVEAELEKRGTTLADYLHRGQGQGKSIETLTYELRTLTGIPFSVRTLYRWADRLEQAS